MRLRFRSITYTVGGTPASLERHYRELRETMLRAGAHYGLQSTLPWRPPVDIHETPDAIVVKMELAGVSEEDIDITLYDNALVVSGHRENDIAPGESVYYHEAQVRYGPFRADILLPIAVDQDAVQASYEHGFLRVRLPKATPTKQRIVSIGGEKTTDAHAQDEPADALGDEFGDESDDGHGELPERASDLSGIRRSGTLPRVQTDRS